MNKKIVAVDGPAGAGKSTVSKLVAKELDYTYIDTGAMYRAVALKVIRQNKTVTDDLITNIARDIDIDLRYENGVIKVFVDGEEVTEKIRTPEVSKAASDVAKSGFVRERLTELQRKMATRGGVIMDGRDIGTHVLPNADVKIYLTASVEERARRRCEELKAKGLDANLDEVARDIQARDKQDMEREIAPLKQAEDAILLDTTKMSIDEVVNSIVKLCSEDTKLDAVIGVGGIMIFDAVLDTIIRAGF